MEMAELMDKLKREAREGGELTEMPCPQCGRPRSQRSDYVRCTPCGLNWLKGEDLTKHPLLSREPYQGSAYSLGTSASKTEPDITA